jgi:hypothetical protein
LKIGYRISKFYLTFYLFSCIFLDFP